MNKRELIKYILHTSILLAPFCSSVKYSTNTSLYAYSINIIDVKKPTILLSIIQYLLSLFIYFIHFIYSKSFRTQEVIPVISFVVPFPQICKYHQEYEDKDHKFY